MSVMGNLNGFAIMDGNRLVDVDALERENAELRAAHELAAKAHENRIERDMKLIEELQECLERWRKGYNSLTYQSNDNKIAKLKAELTDTKNRLYAAIQALREVPMPASAADAEIVRAAEYVYNDYDESEIGLLTNSVRDLWKAVRAKKGEKG